MKRVMLFALCLMASVSVAQADNAKPVEVKDLPASSQQFMKDNFKEREVSVATVEREFLSKKYDVSFVDGSSISFNKKGEWNEIDNKKQPVPANCVPDKIAEFVAKKYPKTHIISIEKGRKETEVKLSNGLELTFDSKYNLIGLE